MHAVHDLAESARAAPRAGGLLARVAVAAGLGWAIAFVAIGLRFGLQRYGDGAMFSYSVATGQAWAVHWHNIANRTFVYLTSLAPAEAAVRLTGNAEDGIALYGLLFFAAPLAGLVATYFADRSEDRAIFTAACAATAGLCPLVFGFPTEMWVAHAVFWPALALAHHAPRTPAGAALVLASLLALVFTHEAALVLALAVAATLLLAHGPGDARFRRGARLLALALAAWVAVKVVVPPDGYFAPVLAEARLHFFNPARLADRVVLLILAALAGYGALALALRRLGWRASDVVAAAPVVAALAAYWLLLDPPLHAEHRYFLRTLLVLALPALAALATLPRADAARMPAALRRAAHLVARAQFFAPPPDRARSAARASCGERLLAGALVIVVLVHAVETARFVAGWTDYIAAVRALASGTAADPALGDARFVSSARIDPSLQALAWSSTTPFLSVLVAPGMRPARLVVDPAAGYFWLPCALARESEAAASEAQAHAVPREARGLVRRYACLHRR